jgi:hypothetical protein
VEVKIKELENWPSGGKNQRARKLPDQDSEAT